MSTLKHIVVLNTETRRLVVPVGKHFKDAVQYDPAVDKGKLVCVHCLEARMTHRDEKKAIAGGNVYGWQSHFATIGTRAPKKPKQDREGNVIPYKKNAHKPDCVEAVLVPAEDDEPDKINHDKGYKIYIDMGYIRRTFAHNASPVTRDANTRRIVNMHPDLVDRERMTLKKPADFVRAIKYADPARLHDSVVVFEDHMYTWKELFIRTEPKETGHPFIRWANLGKRVIAGQDAPAIVHFDLSQKQGNFKPDGRHGTRLQYHLGTVVVPHPTEPRPVTVKFWLNVRNEHLFDTFKKAGPREFLALVHPDMFRDSREKGVYHVDLTITDPQRVVEADLHQLGLEARQNAARRQAARGGTDASADFKLT